jgi:DNA-binding MarR family transcriptional regulator
MGLYRRRSAWPVSLWFGIKRQRLRTGEAARAAGECRMHKNGLRLAERRPRAGEAGDERPPEPNGETRLGPLDDFIGFHLRLAQHASFRSFARRAGLSDLKPGRFAAMMVIHANPGITQSQLGRAIARDKSSVTPLIRELGRDGLVRRLQSKTDRRSVSLTLTREGEKMLRRLLAHAVEHDRRLDAIVGPDKRELIRLLKKIADGLA